MTFTIGTFSYTGGNFVAQPFGYDESDTKAGLVARKIRLSALMTAVDWAALVANFNSWRDARILDPDSKTSNSIGTTVAVTFSANGVSWSAVPCWYLQAPEGQQTGAYVQATVELVDAAQALEVLQKSDEKSQERFYFGTFTVGSTVLNLIRPPQTYQDTPSLALTASGNTYVTGPLAATRVRQLEGDTDAAGWTDIQSWFEAAVAAVPGSNQWFPVSAPSATAEALIVDGVRTDRYTVSLTLAFTK